MERFAVTAVDYGDTCDGKARILFFGKTREEAKSFVDEDIKSWADERAGENIEVNFEKMSASYRENSSAGCEWNIERVVID